MEKQEEIIQKTLDYIKKKFEGEGSGHDWWHIYRVWKNAITIGKEENADLFVVQLAALLHDIEDFKFNKGDSSIGAKAAKDFLKDLDVEDKVIIQVCEIVETVSFKGKNIEKPMRTIEGKVVRDADRLDAIGAIGIARCFTYGGSKKRILYNPDGKLKEHDTVESYLKGADSSIHHFHEKLLLLKDLMLTKTGRKIAIERHKYMQQYLTQFHNEWGGK